MEALVKTKITSEMLEAVTSEVNKLGLSEVTVSQLRALFPGVYFTWCMDDDVQAAKPVLQRPGFNLYLVGSGGHCLGLTSACESATGIILAEVIEDEDKD